MQYKILFQKLSKIINTIDPMGLIAGGAPVDEYDKEVSKIIIAIKECSKEEQIADIIHNVFKDSFGNAGVRSNYEKIAKEIFKITNR